MLFSFVRGGEPESHQAHDLETSGPIPLPATLSSLSSLNRPRLLECALGYSASMKLPLQSGMDRLLHDDLSRSERILVYGFLLYACLIGSGILLAAFFPTVFWPPLHHG